MGKAKDKHRGFFVSADLVDFPESTDKTPWQAKAANGGKLEALTTFVCEQKGPFDVSLAFDGASKSARRGIESVMDEECPANIEFWLLYKELESKDPRMGKKVAMSSANKEMMHVNLPFNKSHLTAKERGSFQVCGEASTHSTTYSGIPPRRVRDMPGMSPEDKTMIVGHEESPLPDNLKSVVSTKGVPFFWQETKTIKFWEAVLNYFDIHCVVDASPGNGSLALAALKRGAKSIGFALSSPHKRWLTHLVYRAAFSLVGMPDSPLGDGVSAGVISLHFPLVVADGERIFKEGEDNDEEEADEEDGEDGQGGGD